jgi:hypothetical protein
MEKLPKVICRLKINLLKDEYDRFSEISNRIHHCNQSRRNSNILTKCGWRAWQELSLISRIKVNGDEYLNKNINTNVSLQITK